MQNKSEIHPDLFSRPQLNRFEDRRRRNVEGHVLVLTSHDLSNDLH
jgi:hypothetical protein